jgi:cytochrome c551/c552
MRRGALTAACLLAALALAGCGEQGVVAPTAEDVVGTIEEEHPGKAIFIGTGCGACHVFTPAGDQAEGTIGPDLDRLPEYAEKAGQPLAAFTRESILEPSAYIEQGFADVMPKTYDTLPDADLDALVEFLSKPQG